jgi:hypothetical protein
MGTCHDGKYLKDLERSFSLRTVELKFCFSFQLGLDPPSVVKEVVDADVENLNQPLWHGQPF